MAVLILLTGPRTAVQGPDFMVRDIRGTVPDQDIGATTVVINPGQAARVIKEIITVRGINHIIKVVTMVRIISSRAKGVIIIKETSSNSVRNNSSNPDTRVIRRS